MLSGPGKLSGLSRNRPQEPKPTTSLVNPYKRKTNSKFKICQTSTCPFFMAATRGVLFRVSAA